MPLWNQWWDWVARLRPACARNRTFLWMCVVLMGFCVREDLWGVTSLVRALGLEAACYNHLLDFFHSPALKVDALTRLWVDLAVNNHPGLLCCNGRLVVAGDGLKVGKSGKKMPGVKRLHQQSESNTKPEFIMGHSCQAVAIFAEKFQSVVAIPLAARIHEGLVFSNRDQRTLLDKMAALLDSLELRLPYYFVADAYYASRKIILPLLRAGNHLVTRVRSNAVAYLPAAPPRERKRGRPKTYGEKVPLKSLFGLDGEKQTLQSPVYGEKNVLIEAVVKDLLWRPVGVLVRFVAVIHPTRGRMILMTTDLTLDPIDVIRLYGYRFKIEVCFKSALRVVGAFLYHFWMRDMTPIKRKGKDQYLHRKPKAYRDAVRRKMAAYHRFMQLGLIAQGLMQVLATTKPELVWASFGSWFRTIRHGIAPSEAATAIAMRNALPYFLADTSPAPDLAKFILQRLDQKQTNARKLAA